MRRAVEITVALGLLYLAWTYAAELFIAWYSGVDPPLTTWNVVWCVGGSAWLMLAAALLFGRGSRGV